MKEAWGTTLPEGYTPYPVVTQPLAYIRDMNLNITWAQNNAAVANIIAAAVGTNAPTGQYRASATNAIATMRGGRTTNVVPPIGTASITAAVAGAAAKKPGDTKKTKYSADPLNTVVVNLDHNEVCWGLYKAHCGPMREVVEDGR